jgi:hypothetical protein
MKPELQFISVLHCTSTIMHNTYDHEMGSENDGLPCKFIIAPYRMLILSDNYCPSLLATTVPCMWAIS